IAGCPRMIAAVVAKDTVEDPSEQTVLNPSRSTERRAAQPGITIVSCGGAPCFEVIPLSRGALELGRDALADRHLDDERMSRRHLSIALDRSIWTVTDLGSTNGTRVDGVALERPWSGPCPRVIRAGQTLMVPIADITSHVVHGIDTSTETIVGPQLRAAHERIVATARGGQNLLISGPSGSGKEIAAGLFHRACQLSRGSAERPIVALNCATIPAGLAERILFGTRRGAYSGAV